MSQGSSALWSVFQRKRVPLFLENAKPATAGIAFAVSIAAAAFCQTAEGAVLCQPLYQVIVTVVGTVTSGTDTGGVFGSDKNLTGKHYTLIYTIDCAQGSQPPPVGNPPYYSKITATNNSYPISASLTIEGVTISSGFAPSSSAARDVRAPQAGGDASFIAWPAAYNLPTIQTTIWFTSPPEVVSYDWASQLLYYPAATNTATFGQFSAPTPQGLTGANGRLSVTSISVSGPVLYSK